MRRNNVIFHPGHPAVPASAPLLLLSLLRLLPAGS
jgi:hypothetical protein